jgi:NAD(P)-dependent dehydrogenase (short-subunit alcohol dehydrogenase family)
MGKDQNATTIDVALIRETIETNLYGLIETTKAFLPLLRKSTTGAPVILNVSTDMASNSYQARPDASIHVVAYNTSKAAANSYTIALAHELKPEGFKVNAVTPGFTSTKLNFFGQGGKSPQDGAKVLLPWALLGKDGATCLFVNDRGEEFPW